MRRALGIFTIVSLCAACSATTPQATATVGDDAAAHQVHEAYVTAINSNNLDSLLGMLTEDVVFLSAHDPVMVGKAAVRPWLEGYIKAFKTHWDKAVREFVVNGEWAFERYAYRSTDTPLAGVLSGLWLRRLPLNDDQGRVFGFLMGDDTAYGSGYSDNGFRSIQIGMSEQQVRSLVGSPLEIVWSHRPSRLSGCHSFYATNGTVSAWSYDDCATLGARVGLSFKEISVLLGPPVEVFWTYSKSPGDGNYRRRIVHFSKEQVSQVIKGWHLD